MGQLTARQTARRAALEARVRDHRPLGAGLTVDTTHVVLSGAESRQSLCVALTRGRSERTTSTSPTLQLSQTARRRRQPEPHDRRGHPGRHPPARRRAELGHQHPPHPGRAGDPTARRGPALPRRPGPRGGPRARPSTLAALDQVAEQLLTGLSTNPPTHPAQSSRAAGARRPEPDARTSPVRRIA